VSRKMSSTSSRTSVVLDTSQRMKLFMLSQALKADMGDIIREAIDLFYYYTKKYAEDTDNDKIKKLLELAEDVEVWDTGVNVEKVKEYAKKSIDEGKFVETGYE